MTSKQKQILRILILVLLLCVALMFASNLLSIAARDAVLEVSKWGFTTILGALVGSMTTILGTSDQDKQDKTDIRS